MYIKLACILMRPRDKIFLTCSDGGRSPPTVSINHYLLTTALHSRTLLMFFLRAQDSGGRLEQAGYSYEPAGADGPERHQQLRQDAAGR